jgi:Leucine-rich repeat (LRR) protein
MELAPRDKKFVEKLAKSDGLPLDYVIGTLERDKSFEGNRLVSLSLASYVGDELDLTGLDALVKVSVSGEELVKLKLGALPKLVSLVVQESPLASIDLSGCTALESLELSQCPEMTRAPSLPPRLVKLSLAYDALEEFALASTTLESLDVTRCGLRALDVSKMPALVRLDCAFNAIPRLDLAAHERMHTLWCQGNGGEIVLPSRAPFTVLVLSGNPRKKLDARAYPKLETLFVDAAGLTALTLDNPALTNLHCGDNALTKLDLAGAPALRFLHAKGNALRSLDLRAVPKLGELEMDPGVEIECTELQKHVLPALRARYGLPKPTKTISKMDLYQLHAFVASYNWDAGPKALRDVVRHPRCTLETALHVYWLSEPAEYAAFASAKAAPKTERSWALLLKEIETGVAKKKFARGPFGFDVRNVDGVDLSDDHPAIPPLMREPVKPKQV